VVNINTESLPKQSANKNSRRRGQLNRPPQGNDDQQPGDMQDFFNRFFGGQGGQGDDDGDGVMGAERRALGSGFIVDPRGYIITNNHVVDKADKIFVKLSTDPDGGDNGRPATVIGTDKDTDIAVIKIDTKEPLPAVKLGNSDSAQVGDWVLAIGSPFSLSKTVTAGIISAKNRSIDEPSPTGVSQNQFQHFIQTDAAINPGNSGGPLVDLAGNVVGMNTAIYTQSMGSQGVGFAMPANTIASVYNMLIGPEHKVVRGSIGISFQPALNSAVGRMYGFSNGVLVSTVTPNGGAAKAGLQPGDVIVSIDGRKITDGDDLVNDISARRVGSTVKLGYLRNGKQDTAIVAIGDRAKTYADLTGGDTDENAAPQEADAGQGKLGITVSAIPPAVAAKTGIRSGVMVTSVRPGSFGDEINLTKGAIITEINKKPVTDEASYKAIVSGLKSKDDAVFVIHSPLQKNGGNSYVGGTLP
jgi:serine protease Do